MKTKYFIWLLISAIVMIIFPFLAVTFAKGDAGMAICFLLFFAVNPIYSIVVGIFSGNNANIMWSMPIISAVMFLLGTWIFFDMGERAFLLYAGVYFIIGIVSMLISMLIKKKIQR